VALPDYLPTGAAGAVLEAAANSSGLVYLEDGGLVQSRGL